MAKRPRRNHSPAFKAKVALAAVQGDKTLVELSEHFDIHANQITQWKNQLLARPPEAFEGSGPSAPPVDVKTLHAKIGALTLENDFLEGALNKAGLLSAKMIEPAHSLPLTKQAAALGISRSSIYHLPQPVSAQGQAFMNRIDRLHPDYPFAGARMLRDMLHQAGFNVGRKHVGTLMRKMVLSRAAGNTKHHRALLHAEVRDALNQVYNAGACDAAKLCLRFTA